MIIEGGTADEIHRLAVEQGMVTLRQSGLRKAMPARPRSKRSSGWSHEPGHAATRAEWSLRLAHALVAGGYATESNLSPLLTEAQTSGQALGSLLISGSWPFPVSSSVRWPSWPSSPPSTWRRPSPIRRPSR